MTPQIEHALTRPKKGNEYEMATRTNSRQKKRTKQTKKEWTEKTKGKRGWKVSLCENDCHHSEQSILCFWDFILEAQEYTAGINSNRQTRTLWKKSWTKLHSKRWKVHNWAGKVKGQTFISGTNELLNVEMFVSCVCNDHTGKWSSLSEHDLLGGANETGEGNETSCELSSTLGRTILKWFSQSAYALASSLPKIHFLGKHLRTMNDEWIRQCFSHNQTQIFLPKFASSFFFLFLLI